MLEETIRRALNSAMIDGCDGDAATVFAVCAVLAEQPDLALQQILDRIEAVRQQREAVAV